MSVSFIHVVTFFAAVIHDVSVAFIVKFLYWKVSVGVSIGGYMSIVAWHPGSSSSIVRFVVWLML